MKLDFSKHDLEKTYYAHEAVQNAYQELCVRILPFAIMVAKIKGFKCTDRWPKDINSAYDLDFRVDEKFLTFVAKYYYCGEDDYDEVVIPWDYLQMNEGLIKVKEEELAEERRVKAEVETKLKEQEAKRKREDQERSEYERLKKKYG